MDGREGGRGKVDGQEHNREMANRWETKSRKGGRVGEGKGGRGKGWERERVGGWKGGRGKGWEGERVGEGKGGIAG